MASVAAPRYSSQPASRAPAHQKPPAPEIVVQKQRLSTGESVVARRFEKGQLLGKGGFAKCYRFKDTKTHKIYAGKVISKKLLQKSKAKAKLQIEIKLHRDLNHRRIVKMKCWFEDVNNAYIVLELCPNLCMSQLVKRRKMLTEYEARFYMLQLIEGVQYLHAQNIIHRDLKLGNIFLDANMDIKIGDFGLAAKLDYDGQRKKTICGTPNYIAPEILDGKTGHGPPVDIWSMGVILYTFILGRPPYETTDVKATYRRIRKNQYTFPPEKSISADAKALVRRILQLRPEDRPSLESMRNDSYFLCNQTPRRIPCTARKHKPEFSVQDMCAPEPTLSARRPLEPRSTSSLHVNNQPAEHRVLKESNGATQHRSQNGARSSNQPQTARPASRPYEQGMAAAVPQTARERRAPHMRGSDVRPPSRNNAHKAGGNTAVQKANAPSAVPSKSSGLHASENQARQPVVTASKERWATTTSTATAVAAETASATAKVSVEAPMSTREGNPTLAKALAAPISGAMGGTLETMHQHLAMSFAAQKSGAVAHESTDVPQGLAENMPQFWVTKWVDYTSKYGLGYLLSDGSAGVYFNDSTKIVLATNNSNFEYMERTRRTGGRAVDPPRLAHTLEDFPADILQKKVTLLKHFRNYLIEQQQKAGGVVPEARAEDPTCEMVYLKKWVKTRHAILFRLSNKTVQVCFFDQTELMLSHHARVVSYTDKQGKRTTHNLQQVMNSSRADIAKRLKYTKDILHQLISGERK